MMSTSNQGSFDDDDPVGTKPYLIRAIYEWSIDNGYTPEILINADHPDVVVPHQYIQSNRIILNVHPRSVRGLDIGNIEIVFSARFSGKAFQAVIPIASVMAIYGRENRQGMVFSEEFQVPPEPEHSAHGDVDNEVEKTAKPRVPHLKLVK